MWLAPPVPPPRYAGPPRARHVAIAIPARDEAASIAACLAAIDVAAAQAAAWLASLTVLVSANNCADATAAVARRCAAPRFRLIVENIALPPGQAHAGGARRAAVDGAARRLPPTGILATTDADSVVAPDWLVWLLAEFACGVDAVAGAITLAPAERQQLPPLPGRDAEWQLAELMALIEHRLDPQPHDPAPRHIWAWGANLALTRRAYVAIGGLPEVPLAEDRALADRLLQHDFRLRRSTGPLVYTSARTSGRAPGGFADLISGFAQDHDQPCDAALEPMADFARRLRWRAQLRACHAQGGHGATVAAAQALLPPATILPETPHFGALWAAIEAASPQLARQRVYPARLAAELRAARQQLDDVSSAADQADSQAGAAGR